MSSRFLNPFEQEEEQDQEKPPKSEFNESLEDADLKSVLTQKIVIDDEIFDKFENMIKNGDMSK